MRKILYLTLFFGITDVAIAADQEDSPPPQITLEKIAELNKQYPRLIFISDGMGGVKVQPRLLSPEDIFSIAENEYSVAKQENEAAFRKYMRNAPAGGRVNDQDSFKAFSAWVDSLESEESAHSRLNEAADSLGKKRIPKRSILDITDGVYDDPRASVESLRKDVESFKKYYH